jgi:hypothetical protein
VPVEAVPRRAARSSTAIGPSHSGLSAARQVPANAVPRRPRLDSHRKHIDEIAAVSKRELLSVNLDVVTVVSRVLGALGLVRPMQQEIQQRLPEFDPGLLERLDGYARALFHLHANCERRRRLDSDMLAAVAEARRLRAQFLSDATALANRGLLDKVVLRRFAGNRNRLEIAWALSALAQVFRNRWDAIGGRTVVTLEEIEQAERLALDLTVALGRRDRGPGSRRERQLLRAQAFTLVVRQYDQLRRALSYLHWGDERYKRVALSLYADRKKRHRDAKDKPKPEPSATLTLATGAEPAPLLASTNPARPVATWSGNWLLPANGMTTR